ncbi:Serine-threonine protein kinase [Entamoeba marina]
MSHSYSIGDVRVKGDIIDKVFENTVNISCDSLFQNDVLIKHGLIFRFCPVPLAADYLYELWHYPHSFNIEKLISEHIFLLESKTVVSLFTILKQSGIFEHIAHQFLFGNLIYGRCFQMYLDQFLSFNSSLELGSIVGELCTSISNNKHSLEIKEQQNIISVAFQILHSFQLQSDIQIITLRMLRVLQSRTKNIPEEKKEIFYKKQSKTLLTILHFLLQQMTSPKKIAIELWKKIESFNNQNIIKYTKSLFVVCNASYTKKFFSLIEFCISFVKEFQTRVSTRNTEYTNCINSIIMVSKMFLISETKLLHDFLKYPIGELWDPNYPLKVFSNATEVFKNYQINNMLFTGPLKIITFDSFVSLNSLKQQISNGNIDLLHALTFETDPNVINTLVTTLTTIKLPWEVSGSDKRDLIISEKGCGLITFYSMYVVGHNEKVLNEKSVLLAFLQLLGRLLTNDFIKLLTLDKNNKGNSNVLKKYFSINDNKQCSLYYFHALVLAKINNIEFIKDDLLKIYNLYLGTNNEEVTKELKKNKNHISEVLHNLNNKEELENSALKLLGEMCVKTEDANVMKQGQSLESVKNLIALARENTVEYFNKIDEGDLIFGKKLGSGVFAVVKSGYYKGNKVAIKMFSESSLQFRTEDFLQEIAVMSLLHHPNVIKTYGATVALKTDEESTFYIVTELASCGSLENLIDEQRIDKIKAKQLMIGISNGMKFLHELKIVHRDLKPANILLGENDCVKIADFGLSSFVNKDGLDAVLGSLKWVSPERLKKEKYAEPSDVYAFAIISWQILTLKEPFEGIESAEKLEECVVDNNQRPSLTGIQDSYVELLQKCWDKSPKNRLTFDEILEQLTKTIVD